MRTPLRLAWAAAILALATAANAENRTTIQVSTVLASNEGRTFDSRLASLKSELKQMRFRSYSLVRADTRVLHGNGGQTGMELPNGRYLHITTREHTPDHLRLHILLNEDNKPILNTYMKLETGNVVLLGGPRDENGTLIIAIGSRPWKVGDDEDGPDEKPASGQSEKAPDLAPGVTHDMQNLPPCAPAPAVPAASGAN
jgi:hypothetical protein